MEFGKNFRKVSIVVLLALASVPVMGQDLLARQAPVDRKMKAVDTLVTNQLKMIEEKGNPASELYGEFSNAYVHKTTTMPDRYKIDLRHFCMPTVSRVVTSNFGSRWGRKHNALDIKVYIGDTIRAAFSGKVRIVRNEPRGYGRYIVIRHYNGLETVYGHLSKQIVKENQEVKAGDVIGLGGNTGRSTGSHLHFETRLCGVALNPALMFDFRNQDVTGDFYEYNKATYARESAEATRLRGKVGNGSYTREQVQGISPVKKEQAKNSSTSGEKLYHKVKYGETLSSIAKKRGVTVEQICRLNGYKKNKVLTPGQILRYS